MASSGSSAVKKYDCLFTTQLTKKQKTWKDGHIRHHHYNSKTYLLAEDGAVLAETFYRPPAGGSKQRFSDDFVLEGEVEFETGYLVEVGDLVWKGSTNLSEITKATKEARSKASEEARAWAASEDGSGSLNSPGPSSTTSRYASPNTSNSGKGKSSENPQLAPISANGSLYRGFGIPPPRSYLGGKQAISAKGAGSSSKTSTSASSRPYAASPSTTSRFSAASSSKPYTRPSPLDRISALGGDSPSSSSSSPRPRPGPAMTPMVGTPSKATASPFKPPRGMGTPTPKGGSSAARTGGGPSSALAKRSLSLDWREFGEEAWEGGR
ncbi:hypothetical protein BCR35DRAFT_350164 [Leucosporidium creatinivorum]|uniref:5'-3' DNA helicase ZGRF1-like N-terminal domain-containing protein n=1 Tax=Leucosporidium creatinivorum TaxID=106004 RepID=A0A1Y2FZZ0_9BASI|nr:hypothetical protein BCR35DRAFT_350164 [Leucosporidium creatinivorum]